MIKSIETRYAGCRFRSRLEARWAVFFDHLGIAWEYERQGYLCKPRLTNPWDEAGEFPYLPDFWFPEFSIHGEVKGSLTHPELTRLLDTAASLSSGNGAGCHDSGGHDMVVFGNIPRAHEDAVRRLPTRLHMHKGDLLASGWNPVSDPVPGSACPWQGDPVAADYGDDPGIYDVSEKTPEQIVRWLVRGSWADMWTTWYDYDPLEAAYTAARSARFEHGQSGA